MKENKIDAGALISFILITGVIICGVPLMANTIEENLKQSNQHSIIIVENIQQFSEDVLLWANKNKDKPIYVDVTTEIPFALETSVDTRLQQTSPLVVARITKPVYFQKAYLPAGTRLLGRFGGVIGGDRLSIDFYLMVNTNGHTLPIAGFTYDANNTLDSPYWTIDAGTEGVIRLGQLQ